MSTQLEERPIDRKKTKDGRGLWHTYCSRCNGHFGKPAQPGDVAFCGHVKTRPAGGHGFRGVTPPPPGYQACIVCDDLYRTVGCPKCGQKR